MNAQASAALATVGLTDIDPTLPVRQLGIAQMQLIEIARALSAKSDVLILDEPTATLTDREVQRLAESCRAFVLMVVHPVCIPSPGRGFPHL